MSVDLKTYTSDITDNKLEDLILKKEEFEITQIRDMSHVVKKVESVMEQYGFKVRVYRENRSAAIAAAAVPTGITQAVGLWSAIGIGIHNLATFNPDFEIAKRSKSIKIIPKK